MIGDAVAHHAAGFGGGFENRHGITHANQVISSGQAGGAGTDHSDFFGFGDLGGFQESGGFAAILLAIISRKSLDGIDGDRLVDLATVAFFFAGMRANAADSARERDLGADVSHGIGEVAARGH